MATTSFAALPYPTLTGNQPNVPQDMQNLATALDTKIVVPVATPAARQALSAVADGMVVFEQSTDRYYRYNSSNSTWYYLGGAPPPIVTASAGAGWNNVGGNMPGAYLDGSGLVHLVGAVSPATTYNPTDLGTHTAATLPTGYRPARTVFFTIPQPTFALVIGMIDTAGVVNIVGGTTSSIAAGTAHYLEACPPFHPGFTGTLPLA